MTCHSERTAAAEEEATNGSGLGGWKSVMQPDAPPTVVPLVKCDGRKDAGLQ